MPALAYTMTENPYNASPMQSGRSRLNFYPTDQVKPVADLVSGTSHRFVLKGGEGGAADLLNFRPPDQCTVFSLSITLAAPILEVGQLGFSISCIYAESASFQNVSGTRQTARDETSF